jgi:ring-1,2-phenylacetyl-CoA epoxidase subunit PaaD
MVVTTAEAPIAERAWAVLEQVMDPEVPALSVCDLGLVRDVQVSAEGVHVVLTPTYSGCPATEVIERDVIDALEAAGFAPARVTMRRAPAWSSDWISAAGRRKLLDYGIAPPGPVDASVGAPLRFHRRADAVACPRCASANTERLAAFGSTACKATYRCLDCREPFEYFKPI